MKRGLCIILIAIMAISLAACGAPDVVVFIDAVLEARVRDIMGIPEGDITLEEAEAVTELMLGNDWQPEIPEDQYITDIDGLQYFTNVTNLELSFNGVSDISPLSAMTSLKRLCIGGNAVSDLSPISGLGLEELQIWGNNGITDLSPLAGMEYMSVLMIGSCQVTDISVLANMKGLYILDMGDTPVSDISPLAGLPIGKLYLSGCPIEDYSPIEDIYDSLEDKDFELISADDVSDEPLVFEDANFEIALHAAMGIEDGVPITQKDAYLVQSLEIYSEKSEDAMFSDIGPLAYFVNLKSLTFNSNKISDISALSGLTKLTSLDIGYNLVSDLSPLAGLTQLELLVLKNNQITDISALSGLTNLWQLWISDNQIKDVSPLSGMTKLTSLQLANNPIEDYSPLADIYPNLTYMDFELN